jgi:hypothetical protein
LSSNHHEICFNRLQIMSDPFLLAKFEDGLANAGLMRLQRPDSSGRQPELPPGSQAHQLPAPDQSLRAATGVSKKTSKRK